MSPTFIAMSRIENRNNLVSSQVIQHLNRGWVTDTCKVLVIIVLKPDQDKCFKGLIVSKILNSCLFFPTLDFMVHKDEMAKLIVDLLFRSQCHDTLGCVELDLETCTVMN